MNNSSLNLQKNTMRDIENREDILLIMRNFYDRLLKDNSINFFFTKATDVDQHLEKHFEILADFWEQGLFLKEDTAIICFKFTKIFMTNPFSHEHFEIWLDHLYTSIDENFDGPNCDVMKK